MTTQSLKARNVFRNTSMLVVVLPCCLRSFPRLASEKRVDPSYTRSSLFHSGSLLQGTISTGSFFARGGPYSLAEIVIQNISFVTFATP